MRTDQAECLVEAKATLGEGPVWDETRQGLWWVDIVAGRVHLTAPDGPALAQFDVGEAVGAAVLRQHGGLILATKTGFKALDTDTGAIEPIANPEADKPDNRFNDGKVDPMGRFWAGTMADGGGGRMGALYRLDAGGRVEKMVDDVAISNGLAWTADGKTMYFIDTADQCVWAFDFDAAAGSLGNRRKAVDIPPDMGAPDGMAIDAEGRLWTALWGGGAVAQWDPESGECLAKIETGAAHTTSCAFGGPDMDMLYITTARVGRSDAELEAEPLSGGLFAYKTDTTGPASHRYAG